MSKREGQQVLTLWLPAQVVASIDLLIARKVAALPGAKMSRQAFLASYLEQKIKEDRLRFAGVPTVVDVED